MLFAFIAFWVLLFLGREELGLSGMLTAIAVWLAIVVGSVLFEARTLILVGIAALDIVLVLIVFKGDVKLR